VWGNMGAAQGRGGLRGGISASEIVRPGDRIQLDALDCLWCGGPTTFTTPDSRPVRRTRRDSVPNIPSIATKRENVAVLRVSTKSTPWSDDAPHAAMAVRHIEAACTLFHDGDGERERVRHVVTGNPGCENPGFSRGSRTGSWSRGLGSQDRSESHR
jgi:hypothetical protein